MNSIEEVQDASRTSLSPPAGARTWWSIVIGVTRVDGTAA
jgi:hypothetical protein